MNKEFFEIDFLFEFIYLNNISKKNIMVVFQFH